MRVRLVVHTEVGVALIVLTLTESLDLLHSLAWIHLVPILLDDPSEVIIEGRGVVDLTIDSINEPSLDCECGDCELLLCHKASPLRVVGGSAPRHISIDKGLQLRLCFTLQ